MPPCIDGQHLSLEQLQAYTRPSNASVAAVTQWLQKHQGVESFSFTPSDSFVSVTLPLWQAERMLNTKFGIFKHENGAEILRTLETHLPEDVHSHISKLLVPMELDVNSVLEGVIAPTTYFDNFRHHASQVKQVQQVRTARLAHAGKAAKAIKKACPKGGCTAAVEAACVANAITPACLQAVYNVNYTPKVPKKQNLAVTVSLILSGEGQASHASVGLPRAILQHQGLEPF
jgi:tripeptidyl-peptidase-1